MFYIETIDKPTHWEKFLKLIKIKSNILQIPITGQMSDKNLLKIANKIDKIISKTYSKKIVLAKELYENELIKNFLYSKEYDIVDGKWLFEAMSCKVVDFIVNEKKLKKEETSISILVNDLSDYMLQSIKKFTQEFKLVNIVTNHIEKFKKVEDKILEESGLMITVTNNKKKSLQKSQIILNVDFPCNVLNSYNIFENAVLINIYNEGFVKKKRFNGTTVNNYDINVNSEAIFSYSGDKDKYYTKHLYEAELYHNMPYSDLQKRLQNNAVEIRYVKKS